MKITSDRELHLFMKLKTLYRDDSAVEGMPMRIAIAVILFSVISGLSAKALHDLTYDSMEKNLMGELSLIEKRAAAMYMHGGARDIGNPHDFSGSVERIHVKIPDNVVYVAFGSMPVPGGGVPSIRDLHTDNIYHYVLDNGRVQTGSSIARFSANDSYLSTPFVLYPGEYELTLELVKNNNGTYVRIE